MVDFAASAIFSRTMNGIISLVMLVGLAFSMGMLGVWSGRKRKEVREFYQKHSLYLANDAPAIVRKALGETANASCCQGKLTTKAGDEIPFYWWDWVVSSQTYSGSAPQTSLSCFLGISFAPLTISEESEQNAVNAMQGRTAMEKLKGAFSVDTHTPIRAEKLADGSFLICWQVLQRVETLEDKLTWMQENIAANPIKNMKAVFYRHDKYFVLCAKFQAAWPTLRMELHHPGIKLDKEGWDEFEENTIEPDLTTPNTPLFALNDDDTAAEAQRLFSQHYGAQAYILRNGPSVPERETLADCNNPFTLPLNQFSYGEFKRRFSERWPNLSIQLYNSSPYPGGLGQNKSNQELGDDFDMKTLKNTERTFLHDYLYISDWGTLLGKTDLFATIKPSKPEIAWDRNSIYKRLRDF